MKFRLVRAIPAVLALTPFLMGAVCPNAGKGGSRGNSQPADRQALKEGRGTCPASTGEPEAEKDLGPKEFFYGAGALAQSFQVDGNIDVLGVELRLRADKSNLPGTLILTLEGDRDGKPDGNVLRLSTLLSANVLSKEKFKAQQGGERADAPSDVYAFGFNSSVALKKGETYWLRLSSSDVAASQVVRWQARRDNSFKTGRALYEDVDQGWMDGLIGGDHDFLFQMKCTEPEDE